MTAPAGLLLEARGRSEVHIVTEVHRSWPLDRNIERLHFRHRIVVQPAVWHKVGFVQFDYKPFKVPAFARPLRKLLGEGKVREGHVARARKSTRAGTLTNTYCTETTILCLSDYVILVNFNEDLLHQRHSSLQTVMSNHEFTQLVQCPTTPQGTLIDRVYYRNQCTNPT